MKLSDLIKTERKKGLTAKKLARALRREADKNNPSPSETPVVSTMDQQTPFEPQGMGKPNAL
jgi:hypothetical protein